MTAPPRRDTCGGFVTVQFVAAAALSLFVFASAVNLVVFQYGRGVVRAALDEGVRAGAGANAGDDACERVARATLADLLGGSLGEGVELSCAADAAHVRASAAVQFTGWLPWIADWRFTTRASARRRGPP